MVNNSPNLRIAVGKDAHNKVVNIDLEAEVNLIVVGIPGSGKSTLIHSLITTLIYKNKPDELRLIVIDPSGIELSTYDSIPYLLTPIISTADKAISSMKWAVNEAQRRIQLLREARKRNIVEYNAANEDADYSLPTIVIVIDGLSELTMYSPQDIEALLYRIAQCSRIVGIHLVLTSNSVGDEILEGLKPLIPTVIAYKLSSQSDSRKVLDTSGAEKLSKHGDMLLRTKGVAQPILICGADISIENIYKLTDSLRVQSPPQYNDEVVAQPVQLNGNGGVVMDFDTVSDVDMYKDALRVVVESGKASTSLLQRHLRVGYARAARLIEMMQDQGAIGPADGSRPRDVLVSSVEEISKSN